MEEKELLKMIEEAARDGRKEINLRNNGIEYLPAEIGKFTNLTKIDLSFNRLTSVPKELGQLKNLTKLYLFENQLTSVPDELGRLTNLTTLYLHNNRLTSVPKELGQLKNLNKLYLTGNQLTSVPEELGKLRNLEGLDIGVNQLKSIPEELGKLKNLTELYLSGNQLTSVPEELGKLTNLTLLELHNNQLTSVPEELGKLTNLTELNLNENQITSVPKEIGQLTNLTELDLNENQLKSIPKEFGQLTKLTTLDLGVNQLTSVPEELGQLKNLTALSMYHNQLTSVPKELGQLKNLVTLNLSGNGLTSVPREIVDFGMEISWKWILHGNGIILEGNPLESPPIEIVKQGTEAVREYFKSLEVEKRALNEVKVLLVGNGAAGKTSIVKRLTGSRFDKNEPQTPGVNIVNIEDWQIGGREKGIKVHFWDFGGQDLMQATHQMFYSVRSLYVLVLNAREEPEAEDWLKHIESFGGESPILVVINKIDENQNYDVNRKSLREKYRGIRNFYRISCKTGEGIEGFSRLLQEELGKVELVRSLWGRDWLKVKEELENSKKDYITYSDYKEICRGANVTSNEAQRILLEYLHSLGVILHFEGYDVKDTQVLNPAWMTEAIYRILNSKKLSKNKGYLRKEWLGEILNENEIKKSKKKSKRKARVYSAKEERYIIELMAKFQLCFELADDRDVVLVPDLLDEQEPEFDFEDKKCIDFHFDYDFLPKPVMPRFMVRRHRDIEGRLCWRTGTVLHDKAFRARALVKLDKQEKRIHIRVNGEQRRDYFSTIRKTFLDINAGFQKLKVKQFIGLVDNDRVEYDDIIGCELEGHETILRIKSGKRYRVAELLGQIESPRETQVHIENIIANKKAHVEVAVGIGGGIAATGKAKVHIEIKVEQAVEHLDELKKIIEGQPKQKIPAVVKRKGLEIIHDALKDVAKRQLAEAAKKVFELGKDVAPMIVNTAAYNFFKGMMGM